MEQGFLFPSSTVIAPMSARDHRTRPEFLCNQFETSGKYEFALVRKQEIRLEDLGLIACTNTIDNDLEYFDFGVHFFVDDYRFEKLDESLE